MSPSTSQSPCEKITIFSITSEYLGKNEGENQTICGICHEDFGVGEQAGRNGCCSALACLGCLSRAANLTVSESRGGMLPVYAKCQLCAAPFDRQPLNDRVPVLRDGDKMPDLSLAHGGEEVDVKVPSIATIGEDLADEETAEETLYQSENIRVTKTAGVWKYSIGTVDTFIDDDFLQDGTKLDLAGAISWGRYMTSNLPTEQKAPRKEACAGSEVYTIYEMVSERDEDE